MIVPNPAPTIPALEADNAIDLVKLGNSPLRTYIDYPGITHGHYLILNWRGCGPDGSVVDEFDDSVEVIGSELTPDGMPVDVETHTVVAPLDQGWAFYSYRVEVSGVIGDESRRIFFYVGKRPRAKPDLPVLQIKESHDLHLDLSSVTGTAGVWAGPYEAMAEGDIVTHHCRRFLANGDEYLPPLEYSEEVTKQQVGKPLALFLNKSDLNRINGGRIEVNYGIQYVDTATEKTLSSRQTIQLVAPTLDLLPALEVVGHTPGQPISPARYPDGMPVRIAAYSGMSVGDQVFCYASSDADDAEDLVIETQVDASTIDKGFIEFFIDPQWVKASNGKAIDLRYQFAWIGTAMSAPSYSAMVREALSLPMAIVVGAVPEDDPVPGQGELDVYSLSTSGVSIRIDDLASYGPDDKIEVYWEGYGTTGHYIATSPTTPDGRVFNIPPQHIPANFGKKVQVYYCVTPKGETAPEKSDVFVVQVLPIPAPRYLSIQSKQAQSNGGTISVKAVPGVGELFSFPVGWHYIREDQYVNAVLVGKSTANGQTLTVPIFDNHKVTSSQGINKKVETYLSKIELAKFRTEPVSVQVTITYEPGAAITLRETVFTLIA